MYNVEKKAFRAQKPGKKKVESGRGSMEYDNEN